jgi:hypothetical protein
LTVFGKSPCSVYAVDAERVPGKLGKCEETQAECLDAGAEKGTQI